VDWLWVNVSLRLTVISWRYLHTIWHHR